MDRYLQTMPSKPVRRSSAEIVIIVDAPAAGGGRAVRRGKGAGARPGTRSRTRTGRVRGARGQLRPVIVSTPARRQQGVLEDTGLGTVPAFHKGVRVWPPLPLQTGRRQTRLRAAPAPLHPYSPYQRVTIFWVWLRLVYFQAVRVMVDAGTPGG